MCCYVSVVDTKNTRVPLCKKLMKGRLKVCSEKIQESLGGFILIFCDENQVIQKEDFLILYISCGRHIMVAYNKIFVYQESFHREVAFSWLYFMESSQRLSFFFVSIMSINAMFLSTGIELQDFVDQKYMHLTHERSLLPLHISIDYADLNVGYEIWWLVSGLDRKK